MMSAWWIFASTAILSARYLKSTDSTCCTAPLWWALHRPLMLLSFLCASLAFFAIYYIADWKVRTCTVACTTDDYLGQLHSIIGTITYAFMCFQIVLGVIRPSANSPMRPCFNWLHWMVGTIAWICACAFIVSALICEYFHRFRHAIGEKSETSSSSFSSFVPLLIVVNLLIAMAGIAIITWMMLEAFQGYGF
ncbi:hypothetical protein PFISCL1PPCAC_2150, partial [Pristionchus fissidentatus]